MSKLSAVLAILLAAILGVGVTVVMIGPAKVFSGEPVQNATATAAPVDAGMPADPPSANPSAETTAAPDTPDDTFVAVSTHLDRVQAPKDVFQTAGECTGNPICAKAAMALASATGVPVDKMMAGAAALATTRAGEGGYTYLTLPQGYKYCSASITLPSIVPHDGDRGSTFLARADERGLYFETWTPTRNMFDGRSWVEGDISVLGVKDAAAATEYAAGGKCHAPVRAILYCRGGGCGDGASINDTGQAVSTTSPPAAGSRN